MRHWVVGSAILLCLCLVVLPAEAQQRCGNGVREGAEECDDGMNNSDNNADACRTDCQRARCGDWTTDSNEECDDGNRNNDQMPGACRTDCREAWCGDGVLDLTEGEQCDDGNNDDYDGCSQCMTCYKVRDGLSLSRGPVSLCPGEYFVRDIGSDGVLFIDGDNVVLDCAGAVIRDPGFQMQSASIHPNVARAAGGRQKKSTGGSAQGSGGAAPRVSVGQTARNGSNGTGIVVRGTNAVVHGCRVTGFNKGIVVTGSGVALHVNDVCGNNVGIRDEGQDNGGVKNACSNVEGW